MVARSENQKPPSSRAPRDVNGQRKYSSDAMAAVRTQSMGLSNARRKPKLGSTEGEYSASTVRMAKFHRSEEHTSELQSLMRISYAVFCLKKKSEQRRHIGRTTYRKN